MNVVITFVQFIFSDRDSKIGLVLPGKYETVGLRFGIVVVFLA